MKGTLTVLVSHAFVETHSNLLTWIEERRNKGLRMELLPKSCDISSSEGWSGLKLADKAHEKALLHALTFNPDQILCMYLDHAQLAVRRLEKELEGVLVSGILFRPTLHEPVHSFVSWLARFRKRFVLKRAVQSRCLHALFSLDPEAVSAINKLAHRSLAYWLPDGTQVEPADVSLSDLRSELEIAPDQKVLLLFGALSARKGVFVTLEALENLDNILSNQVTLVLAGKMEPSERESIVQRIIQVQKHRQIIHIDGFVTDGRMTALFEMSDVVLAPYPFHIGSSGVLIRAAHASKPLIGSDYGMVGRNITQYELGLALDCTSTQELKAGLERIVASGWKFKSTKHLDFAQMNSWSEFGRVVFQHATPN